MFVVDNDLFLPRVSTPLWLSVDPATTRRIALTTGAGTPRFAPWASMVQWISATVFPSAANLVIVSSSGFVKCGAIVNGGLANQALEL